MRIWLAIGVLVIAIGLITVWLVRRERTERVVVVTNQTNQTLTTPLPSPSPVQSSTPELSPSPVEHSTPTDTPETTASSFSTSFVGVLYLIIPVSGVRSEQLVDTFTAARSEGRTHDAIDIPAAAGTPVLAAADGEIIKLFQSERGGTTIYQFSADKKLVFYYAHLQSYAVGLTEGRYVHQGEVIAYVGDTGNAGPGNFHLHFSIAIVADPKRYWEGTNINPYPLLHR